MKKENANHLKTPGLRIGTSRSTFRLGWLTAVVVIAACTIGLAVRAHSRRSAGPGSIGARRTLPVPERSPATQELKPFVSRYLSLGLQPEADRLRQRIGRRFLAPGQELLVLSGILTVGEQNHTVRVVRSQEDGGELFTMALDGGPASLSWSAGEGTKSTSGRAANEAEKALVERIVMDSADQFVLAQLRGASYYNVAYHMRPPGAGSSETYEGPIWDVVRLGEPKITIDKIGSPWRLFYINSDTGLIDRVVSQEREESIVADISGWVNQGGEMSPTRITWSRSGQVVMKLTVTGMEISSR